MCAGSENDILSANSADVIIVNQLRRQNKCSAISANHDRMLTLTCLYVAAVCFCWFILEIHMRMVSFGLVRLKHTYLSVRG